MQYHRVRLTAAADIDLPQSGLYLHEVTVIGGAVASLPGAFALLYDGTATAHFPVPAGAASQVRARRRYLLNHQIKGTRIQSGAQTFRGGLAVVELVFADGPNPKGAPMLEYRSIRFSRTDGGAVTGTQTVNYDVGPNHPREIVVLTSADVAGRVDFPATGSLTGGYESDRGPRDVTFHSAPHLDDSVGLTLNLISDAASTIEAYVYY